MEHLKKVLNIEETQRIKTEVKMDSLKFEQVEMLIKYLKEENTKENQEMALGGLLHLLSHGNGPVMEDVEEWFGDKDTTTLVIEDEPKKMSCFLFQNLLYKSDGKAAGGVKDKSGWQNSAFDTVIVTEQPTMRKKEEEKQLIKETESEFNEEFSFMDAGRRICSGALECFIMGYICLIGD